MTKLKTVEINPDFAAAVEANDGYCPCLIERSEDTLCPCKDFREQTEPGECHCGRFAKVLISADLANGPDMTVIPAEGGQAIVVRTGATT